MNIIEALRYDGITGLFYWVGSGSVAGGINASGYRTLKFKGKVYRQHRLAWYFNSGAFPSKNIDHINGDKLDNRIVNLRDVSQHENCKNRKGDKRNSSGFRGVYKTKYGFISRICVLGKHMNLGTFKVFNDAVSARLHAETQYDFHENNGRLA